jgi:ribulose-5-phosphate 4-epimerase/fuculose-1-phosphate aldolase
MARTEICSVNDIRAAVGEAEWAARVDLAACYRLVALYGMTDLIYNHISAQVPGHDDQYLINPYGMLYEEITASSLVKIDIEGRTLLQPDHGYNVNVAGFYLHAPIHRARPDVKCVLHTHTRAGTAVSTLAEGLLPLSQTAMRFHGRIGYHDFEGPAIDRDECDRVVADLGRNNVLILRNQLAGAGLPHPDRRARLRPAAPRADRVRDRQRRDLLRRHRDHAGQ